MTNKKTFSLVLVCILMSTFFGFLGGVVTNDYVFPYMLEKMKGGESAQGEDVIVKKEIIETSYVEESRVIDVVEKVSPTVVSIVVTKEFRQMKMRGFGFHPFFGNDTFIREPDENADPEIRTVGGGTGFIFTEDGLVLTNKHVVDDEEADYTIILSTGEEYDAEIVDRDMLNDIAVLRMIDKNDEEIQGLPVVEFGQSRDLRVGQNVVAIGYALAEYANSVTTGVISAKGRSILASDGYGRDVNSLSNLLQTDAAINSGNSGGPLLNLAGQVVGMNTAVANNANGIGFAIPVDDVRVVVNSVIKNGKIVRPIIGVRYRMLDEKIANALGLSVDEGALLLGDMDTGDGAILDGSPAQKAGLKAGDVIIAVDGEKLSSDTDLRMIIARYTIGDELKLQVMRDDEVVNISLVLEALNTKDETQDE